MKPSELICSYKAITLNVKIKEILLTTFYDIQYVPALFTLENIIFTEKYDICDEKSRVIKIHTTMLI